MRYVVAALLVAVFVVDVQAGGKRRSRRGYQPVQSTQFVEYAPAVAVPVESSTPTGTSCAEALDEVNAERTKRGLRPFIHDPELSKAAFSCAKARSASHIHGHLASDFAYLPSGASASSAGCGALEPSWGWGTCCTYDNYTYAGAAWVMGDDGRRYMHLFVR